MTKLRLQCVAERRPNYRRAISLSSDGFSLQVEGHALRMAEMQELFRKREDDFSTVQDGMRTIQEFQKTKAQMEQELEDVRPSRLPGDLLQGL